MDMEEGDSDTDPKKRPIKKIANPKPKEKKADVKDKPDNTKKESESKIGTIFDFLDKKEKNEILEKANEKKNDNRPEHEIPLMERLMMKNAGNQNQQNQKKVKTNSQGEEKNSKQTNKLADKKEPFIKKGKSRKLIFGEDSGEDDSDLDMDLDGLIDQDYEKKKPLISKDRDKSKKSKKRTVVIDSDEEDEEFMGDDDSDD